MLSISVSDIDVHMPGGDPLWGITAIRRIRDMTGVADSWTADMVQSAMACVKIEWDTGADESERILASRLYQVYEFWISHYQATVQDPDTVSSEHPWWPAVVGHRAYDTASKDIERALRSVIAKGYSGQANAVLDGLLAGTIVVPGLVPGLVRSTSAAPTDPQ